MDTQTKTKIKTHGVVYRVAAQLKKSFEGLAKPDP